MMKKPSACLVPAAVLASCRPMMWMPSWAAWCLRKAGLNANCAPRTSHSTWSERVFALKVHRLRAKSWPSYSSSSPSSPRGP
eukprot:661781-Heterocapsa_arctica.AAC.1